MKAATCIWQIVEVGEMLVKTSVFFLALAFAVWTPLTFAPRLTKVQVTNAEIKALIEQLSDKSFRVREHATKRLGEIGVLALDAIQEAEESADIETQQRATKLVTDIRAKNRMVTRVNGVEYKLDVKRNDWLKLDANSGLFSGLTVTLQITNKVDRPRRFFLFQNVDLILRKNAKGPDLLDKWYGDGDGNGPSKNPFKNDASPLLKRNQTATITIEGGITLPTAGGGCVSFRQKLCELWRTFWDTRQVMDNGNYLLSISYSNSVSFLDSEPCWVGHAETLEESVSLSKR